MCFFYAEYINVTIDTQYIFKSILGIILFYTILMRPLFMHYRKKKNVSFIFTLNVIDSTLCQTVHEAPTDRGKIH